MLENVIIFYSDVILHLLFYQTTFFLKIFALAQILIFPCQYEKSIILNIQIPFLYLKIHENLKKVRRRKFFLRERWPLKSTSLPRNGEVVILSLDMNYEFWTMKYCL